MGSAILGTDQPSLTTISYSGQRRRSGSALAIYGYYSKHELRRIETWRTSRRPQKGVADKPTIERALMAEREVANANETRQKLARDHLEELVDFYAQMSISEPDEVEKWSKLRMEAASRLAPYQSPKLGVVMIQPTSEQDRLAQMTDEELIADLNRKADALGIEIIFKPKARPPSPRATN